MLIRPAATVYNFEVEFIGRRRVYRASFQDCTGLKATGDIKNVKEGGKNDRPHTHITGISYQPITLSRGMTDEMDLVVLFSNQWDPKLGLTHHYRGAKDDNLFTLRIKKKDRAGNVVRLTELRRCQVIAYAEGDNNATQSAIMIETITVDFDEVYITKS